MKCLEALQTNITNEAPIVESVVVDGAVAVQMLKPGTARTLQEYIDTVFKPYVLKQLEHVKRVDIVWNVYREDSLKTGTREKRGKGTCRRVLPTTAIPGDWSSFLRVDQNKVELFHLLSQETASLEVEHREIYTTIDKNVLHSGSCRNDLSPLQPCTHEEADTRIMLHVKDSAVCGHQSIMIRTIDTDVAVLAISIFHNVPVTELWMAFGAGKHFRYIAIHEVARALGKEKSKALPLFHAMTGCDTGKNVIIDYQLFDRPELNYCHSFLYLVSFLAGKGKKTAWEIWKLYPDLTPVLSNLSLPLPVLDNLSMVTIERFVILLYDKTSVQTEVRIGDLFVMYIHHSLCVTS